MYASKHVAAVTACYREDLRRVFRKYAAADMSIQAQADGGLESVSLGELVYMMREGEMFDDKLTTAELTAIFTRVNARSVEEEEGDDDEEELDFVEFLEVLARMCNAKYPEADRDGESFATCLQSFLHLIFLPTYKKLLKKRTEMRG